jgi:hypothetical protein
MEQILKLTRKISARCRKFDEVFNNDFDDEWIKLYRHLLITEKVPTRNASEVNKCN